MLVDYVKDNYYEGDSISLITLPTHALELYTINGLKDQGFTL